VALYITHNPSQVTILWCKECGRYLQPPKHWVRAEPESKELLTFCTKRIRGLQVRQRGCMYCRLSVLQHRRLVLAVMGCCCMSVWCTVVRYSISSSSRWLDGACSCFAPSASAVCRCGGEAELLHSCNAMTASFLICNVRVQHELHLAEVLGHLDGWVTPPVAAEAVGRSLLQQLHMWPAGAGTDASVLRMLHVLCCVCA
jgi:hypothetical protein